MKMNIVINCNGILIIAAPQWKFQRFGAQQIVRILRSTDNGISPNIIVFPEIYLESSLNNSKDLMKDFQLPKKQLLLPHARFPDPFL